MNWKTSTRERSSDGSTFNLLDQFFRRLCQCVSEVTNGDPDRVGYKDIDELHVSAQWPQNLANAMQTTPVQIALISPHYFSSINCGREFEFFTRRFDLLSDNTKNNLEHPIIPVFWANEDKCWPHATDRAKQLLRRLQLTGPGFPDDYPSIGLSQKMSLGESQACERICRYLADRVHHLAERAPPLPQLEGINNFRELPSAFDAGQTEDKPVQATPAPVVNLAHVAAPAVFAGGRRPPSLDLAP